MAADTVLEVNNIEVVYNKTVQVLRGLSLAVPKGSVVALLGSNGAGKSTTLKAISNVLSLEDGEVTAGNILFKNESIVRHQPHELVRSGLFHVMEGRRIFEDLTVEENLTAATYALSGRQVAPTKFELVYEYFPRLFERRAGRAGYLSGGEQQALALALAVLYPPEILLLDEHTSALDPKTAEHLMALTARIVQERQMTALFTTHNVNHALAYGDRILALKEGRLHACIEQKEKQQLSAEQLLAQCY